MNEDGWTFVSGRGRRRQTVCSLLFTEDESTQYSITYTSQGVRDKFDQGATIANFVHGKINDQVNCYVVTNYNITEDGVRELSRLTECDIGFVKLSFHCKYIITQDIVHGSMKNYFKKNMSSFKCEIQPGKYCLTNNAKVLICETCQIIHRLHEKKIFGVVKSNYFFILENESLRNGKPIVKLFLDDFCSDSNNWKQDYICIREIIEVLYDGDLQTSTKDVQDFCQALERDAEKEKMSAHYLFFGPTDKQAYLVNVDESPYFYQLQQRSDWRWFDTITDKEFWKVYNEDPKAVEGGYDYGGDWDLVRFVRNNVKHRRDGFRLFELIEKVVPSFWKDLFAVTGYLPAKSELRWKGGSSGGAGPSRS